MGSYPCASTWSAGSARAMFWSAAPDFHVGLSPAHFRVSAHHICRWGKTTSAATWRFLAMAPAVSSTCPHRPHVTVANLTGNFGSRAARAPIVECLISPELPGPRSCTWFVGRAGRLCALAARGWGGDSSAASQTLGLSSGPACHCVGGLVISGAQYHGCVHIGAGAHTGALARHRPAMRQRILGSHALPCHRRMGITTQINVLPCCIAAQTGFVPLKVAFDCAFAVCTSGSAHTHHPPTVPFSL